MVCNKYLFSSTILISVIGFLYIRQADWGLGVPYQHFQVFWGDFSMVPSGFDPEKPQPMSLYVTPSFGWEKPFEFSKLVLLQTLTHCMLHGLHIISFLLWMHKLYPESKNDMNSTFSISNWIPQHTSCTSIPPFFTTMYFFFSTCLYFQLRILWFYDIRWTFFYSYLLHVYILCP